VLTPEDPDFCGKVPKSKSPVSQFFQILTN